MYMACGVVMTDAPQHIQTGGHIDIQMLENWSNFIIEKMWKQCNNLKIK